MAAIASKCRHGPSAAFRAESPSPLAPRSLGCDVVTTTPYQDVIAELTGPTREWRGAPPDAWAGFGAVHQAQPPRVRCRPESRS